MRLSVLQSPARNQLENVLIAGAGDTHAASALPSVGTLERPFDVRIQRPVQPAARLVDDGPQLDAEFVHVDLAPRGFPRR